MRLLPLVLCLLTLVPQTNSDRTVPLVFGPKPEDVVIVKLIDAQAEYQRLKAATTLTEYQRRQRAALEIALGTVPEAESLPPNGTRQFLDNEIRRGVRKPLQGRN